MAALTLSSKVLGEGGRPLIVLHGFLGMGDNWASHARTWADMGFEVHLVDQRNQAVEPQIRHLADQGFCIRLPCRDDDLGRLLAYFLANPVHAGRIEACYVGRPGVRPFPLFQEEGELVQDIGRHVLLPDSGGVPW